ncbi:MAG: iron-containing alcohol dehydrogenase [Oscillospiraceae bacterium]|nr:iron-containing alcohol dehydrogenase [Oscillospiraceae bacterium]
MDTKILAGAGAVAALSGFGAKRVFVVTDPYFMKNGVAARVGAACRAEAVEYFADVKPDPTVELAAAGTAKLKAFGADLVVALGGGSAMDCAKAMVYFEGTGLRLVAIPTTSGSGSEVTDFAILTHGEVKHPLVDEKLRPWAAILDSDLLMELPKGLIADTGFDVLAHALEAFVARDTGYFSGAMAKEAFCAAWETLPRSYRGDSGARLPMHQAATMAGLAFTHAGLGLCHALAHALGGQFHVPHGRLNAILLPSVISFNAPAAGAKYAALARAAGIGGSVDTIAVRNLRGSLCRLRRELGLPETLAQAGVAPADVKMAAGDIARAALGDPCCASNPRTADEGAVRAILTEVSGNG